MLKKIILMICVLFITNNISSYGQYKFADIEVETLGELFDTNTKKIWGKKKMQTFYIQKDITQVWHTDNKLFELAIVSHHKKKTLTNNSYVSFIAKKSLDLQELNTRLTEQMRSFFGDYETKNVEILTMNEIRETNDKVWYITEDGYKYEITLTEKNGLTLNIDRKKTDTIPDF